MTDSRPLNERTRLATDLATSFEKQVSGDQENNRYKVKAKTVVAYVKNYLDFFNGQEELRKAPPLKLGRLFLTDRLELPSADYPSIEVQNCLCHEGMHLSNATVHGAMKFDNLSNAAHKDFSLTFTNVTFESQLQLTNYIADKVSIHNCTMQDVHIETHLQKLRIDGKSLIRGECKISRCPDLSVSVVEFGGPFTFTPSAAGDTLKIEKCTYSDQASFAHGQPIKSIAIDDTVFHKGLLFSSPVSKDALFTRVQFYTKADFQNTAFSGKTSFDESEFHCAPEFFGAKLFPDTNFLRAVFLAFSGESEYAAYRELRHLSHDDLKSDLDESRFFAYEQRALANVQVKTRNKFIEALLSKSYGLASDYGQSIVRPLLALFMINVIITIIYAVIPSAIVVAEEFTLHGTWQTRIPESVGLMMQNLFQPFTVFGKAATFIPNCGLVLALSVLQTLLSLIFLPCSSWLFEEDSERDQNNPYRHPKWHISNQGRNMVLMLGPRSRRRASQPKAGIAAR
jgi:hypothetical protein